MSYEIYYARAFIRVGDMYVPMVNQGSNNTWEFSYTGRQIPEKNWQVLNWKRRNRLLFSESEIREIAKDYEQISQESGTCFKSRNRAFEQGEFERWILCGLKSAYSIEEYVSFGNGLKLDDYSATEDSKLYSFKTTSEFFALIDKTGGCKLLNVQFENNREVYKPLKKQLTADYKDQSEYYVLVNPDNISLTEGSEKFFCRFKSKRSIVIAPTHENSAVKSFQTSNAAEKYLDKHKNRLTDYMVKKITKESAA